MAISSPFNLVLYILFCSLFNNAAGQTNNYCDGYLNVKTIKPCPNPESFDIQSEISKPITSVKLDFNAFKELGISNSLNLLLEIKNRYDNKRNCPYIQNVAGRVCCEGWSGTDCSIPVCDPECRNGGTCVAPNVCKCVGSWAGEQCQFKIGSNELVTCYKESFCKNEFTGNTYTSSYCCQKLNGTSYGTANMCAFCNQTYSISDSDPDFDTDIRFYEGSKNNDLTFRTCVLWGLNHFRTFDGTQFEFGGECVNKLASGKTWQINYQSLNCDNFSTCKKKLFIQFGLSTLTVVGKSITYKYGSNSTIQLDDDKPFSPTGTGINIHKR